MPKTPPPEDYEGRSSVMRDSTWLAAEDIDGLGDVTLTIEKVHVRKNVEFDFGRKTPVVYSLKFKGKQRELILNSAKRNVIQDAYGSSTGDWVGKEVTLYVDPNVKMKGEKVKGIRIRKVKT